MSFSILVTQPQIGQELKNAEFILQNLQTLDPNKSSGVIVSNSAIMGVCIESYTELPDFDLRQSQAIEVIRKTLTGEQWVICGFFSTQENRYKTIFIYQGQVSYGSCFMVPTPKGNKKIGILNYHQDILMDSADLQAVFLLEELAFQTVYKESTKISLSNKESLTEKRLEKILTLLSHQYHTLVVNVSILSIQNGIIWDGTCTIVVQDKVEFYQNFHEFLFYVFLDPNDMFFPKHKRSSSMIEHLFHLIIVSLSKYLSDIGLPKVVIAISGGIDSALVASLAVKSLGNKNVLGLLMPGPYSSDHSVSDSMELCKNLGIHYSIHSIDTVFHTYLNSMDGCIQSSLSLENLQARIRGTILMAYSNEYSALAFNTCNKSEDMVGYATLYGDAVGSLAPIGDLYKTEVYELAEYFNLREYKQIIPANIFLKEPSAELKENQKDTDTLPPYSHLDMFLHDYLEKNENPYTSGEKYGLNKHQTDILLGKIFSSEYKRQQSPIILQISQSILYRGGVSQHQYWSKFPD